jgi:hypothetical protein
MPTIPFVVCALAAIPDSSNDINNILFIILNLIVIYSVIYIDVKKRHRLPIGVVYASVKTYYSVG